MTQRNSPERDEMLKQRRWAQLHRIGGGKFTPVYRTSRKWFKIPRSPGDSIIMRTKNFHLHATKGWRRITEYEMKVQYD